MRNILLGVFLAAVLIRTSAAQARDSTGAEPALPVFSIGQPPVWRPYATALGVMKQGVGGAAGLIGVQRPLLNPVSGLVAVSGEALGEWRQGSANTDLRALVQAPGIGVGVGADWQLRRGTVSPLLSLQYAFRRGGILGHGSMLRLDWMAGAHDAFALGVQFPLMQPLAGRTRPRRITALAPRTEGTDRHRATAVAIDAAGSVATVDTLVRVVSAFVNPYPRDDEATLITASHGRYGRSFDSASRAYIAALTRAFAISAGDSTRGVAIAARARATALDYIILPYDAEFGQVKDEGVLDAMLAAAGDHFSRWVADSSFVGPESRRRVLGVYDSWVDMLRELHRHLLAEWKDSRLIWLAPQLALAEDQYDEQAEVDTLIGRAVGHQFTDHNAVGYLRTADLTLEIARSILAARKYHVLWVHDFAGRRTSGALDEVSYTMVADAYLPALTAAVQRYDSAGTFPQYMILLDAFYYNVRDGRIWMSILENPLHAAAHFRAGEERQAAHLRERIDSLRAAVSRSKRFQREAAVKGGERWLAKVVKVHVNIGLPSDFSFRSTRMVPPIPITPDNISRDHRKLAFYDLTETNPYDGELLVTGIGIGEHYASATWEDRGYRVRGPGALEARAALRHALRATGFTDAQIPLPLRATTGTPLPLSEEEARQSVTRVLQVHNEPGFGSKESTVARAMMYSLTPSGSVIIVPDPLWVSSSWAGMLAGAAARGSRVVIIAPAKANAPSAEPPVIALERAVMQRLVEIRDHLIRPSASEVRLESVDGTEGACCRPEVHLGLYAVQTPVTEASARLRQAREGLARAPWIRELIPFDSAALAVLNRATAQAGRADVAATSIAQDEVPRAPQLHQKTQIIARPGAIAALLRQPGWDVVLAQTIAAQSRATTRLADAIGAPIPPADTAAARAADARLQGYQRSLSEADRKRMSFYFYVGSQNHDWRGLLMDGEAGVIVSGFDASAGLVDLFYLMTRTTWVESDSDIDRLVPAPSGLMTRLAHLVKFAI